MERAHDEPSSLTLIIDDHAHESTVERGRKLRWPIEHKSPYLSIALVDRQRIRDDPPYDIFVPAHFGVPRHDVLIPVPPGAIDGNPVVRPARLESSEDSQAAPSQYHPPEG